MPSRTQTGRQQQCSMSVVQGEEINKAAVGAGAEDAGVLIPAHRPATPTVVKALCWLVHCGTAAAAFVARTAGSKNVITSQRDRGSALEQCSCGHPCTTHKPPLRLGSCNHAPQAACLAFMWVWRRRAADIQLPSERSSSCAAVARAASEQRPDHRWHQNGKRPPPRPAPLEEPARPRLAQRPFSSRPTAKEQRRAAPCCRNPIPFW